MQSVSKQSSTYYGSRAYKGKNNKNIENMHKYLHV